MKNRLVVVIVAVLVTAVGLAACSSSAGSGSSNPGGDTSAAAIAAAQQIVTSTSGQVAFKGPNSTPTPPSSKSIGVIVCAAAASGCTRVADGVKSAVQRLGWTAKVFDGQGLASAQNTAVQQALSQGVDGIVLVAIPSANLSQAMSAARSAKVPVVSVEADNTVGTSGADVFGEPDSGSKIGGQALGAFVISDSGGKANVGILHTTEFPSTVNRYESFKAEMDKCSGCKIASTQTYLLSSAIKDVPLMVSSILQSNPNINYMFVDIGQFGALAVQSIQSANKKVKVVSVDCNPADITNIRNGSVQIACAANGLETGGYAAVDDLTRAFTNNPPSDKLVVPTKLLMKNNLPSGDSWTGDFDANAAYSKLWNK